jgi:hypothetical protein
MINMGKKQGSNQTAGDITGIISGVLAKQVISQQTSFSTNTTNNQSSINSKNCVNSITQNSSNNVKVSTQIFMDEQTYQNAITDISKQISQTVDETDEGGFGNSDQQNDQEELIKSIVANILSSEQLAKSDDSLNITQNNNQLCSNSDNGYNVYAGSTDTVFDSVQKTYQKNRAVQKTSTTIKDIMDQTATIKKESMLGSLLKSVMWVFAFIFLVIVIIAAVMVSVYLITLVKGSGG